MSILIAAAATSFRMRNAAKRLQHWWIEELWSRREKRAALVIERFFIYVKKEVEREVQALKKKKKERRRRRQFKQSDEYILERAWLGVAENSDTVNVPVAVPQRRLPPSSGTVSSHAKERRTKYDRFRAKEDRFRARGVIADDAQSDVSGLTDLDFGYRHNSRKKDEKEIEGDDPTEGALLGGEKELGREQGALRHMSGQNSISQRDRRATKGYPRRY